jgi:hypothetical protein
VSESQRRPPCRTGERGDRRGTGPPSTRPGVCQTGDSADAGAAPDPRTLRGGGEFGRRTLSVRCENTGTCRPPVPNCDVSACGCRGPARAAADERGDHRTDSDNAGPWLRRRTAPRPVGRRAGVGARPGRAGIRAPRPGRNADCTARGRHAKAARRWGKKPSGGPPTRWLAELRCERRSPRTAPPGDRRIRGVPDPAAGHSSQPEATKTGSGGRCRKRRENGPLAAAERHTRGPSSPHGSLPEPPQMHTPHCPGSSSGRAWARPA